ncbi:hypothetical protein [Saccharothrix algeriensis]|uniref:DNA polymerase III sliding clamp (Beta) subunit (PCNA family) n=1 Tax=Saccharothrix algeriensis TaxID=173560 RepID=A0A8T8I6Q0_9PSEU|nr:hypothetical protein [Saccharothrix algeriensis]MBM7811902.1 DNA polymerase III sliding clamp (beta) subunit (PCNA family) [Saccharothrix algeriensis]QTR05614.1 hypothetical protein J7S33_14215 [Saccharothrix algeriensis]
MVVEADALAWAVRRATPCSGPHGSVTLRVEGGELRVRGSGPRDGECEESVRAVVGGDRITKTFQAGYLADALKAFSGRQVELRIQDGLRSTVLTGRPGDDGVELKYLVAPLRTVA